MTSDEDDADFWGFAHEVDGLFTALPSGEGARRVRLTGCTPRGGLLRSLERVGRRPPGLGNAWFSVHDSAGATMGSYFTNEVSVVDVQRSPRGAGRVDLTVTLWCGEALPGSDRVWELLRTGGLNRTGLWHQLDRGGRRAWLSVALHSREYRRQGRSDTPAGRVFTLDGGNVVDTDSFWCAIGEAINGPGGYFGGNLDALEDCLRGGWGATTPFTLHWRSSDGARARLAATAPTGGGERSVCDLLLEIFEERGVNVVLR